MSPSSTVSPRAMPQPASSSLRAGIFAPPVSGTHLARSGVRCPVLHVWCPWCEVTNHPSPEPGVLVVEANLLHDGGVVPVGEHHQAQAALHLPPHLRHLAAQMSVHLQPCSGFVCTNNQQVVHESFDWFVPLLGRQ